MDIIFSLEEKIRSLKKERDFYKKRYIKLLNFIKRKKSREEIRNMKIKEILLEVEDILNNVDRKLSEISEINKRVNSIEERLKEVERKVNYMEKFINILKEKI